MAPTVKPRTTPYATIPGLSTGAYSVGERDRMLIQLWRKRYGSTSASAALRDMIEHAWRTREDRPR